MQLRERLTTMITQARGFSEGLLASFTKPSDWTHQLFPGANHALWFAGHMGTSDDFFLKTVVPGTSKIPVGYPEKFGMGSVPTANLADYPPVEEVLAFMRERRKALSDALAGMSNGQLASKLPAGSPEFLSDFSSVFELATWHEGIHAGQLSMTRRALGHPSIMG
jgi:hypothetical protein